MSRNFPYRFCDIREKFCDISSHKVTLFYFFMRCACCMIVEMILSRYYRLDNHDKKISHSSSAQQQSHELQQARVATQQ